jgi:hypothetical protein
VNDDVSMLCLPQTLIRNLETLLSKSNNGMVPLKPDEIISIMEYNHSDDDDHHRTVSRCRTLSID